jgi:hypothetical protein
MVKSVLGKSGEITITSTITPDPLMNSRPGIQIKLRKPESMLQGLF